MFLEFDFVGVPSIKITPILTFDFQPPGPRGTRGARRVIWINKLHNTKILVGQPSGPVFSGLGPNLKIQLPTFCSTRCPDFDFDSPHAPKPPEVIDLAETSFFRVWA